MQRLSWLHIRSDIKQSVFAYYAKKQLAKKAVHDRLADEIHLIFWTMGDIQRWTPAAFDGTTGFSDLTDTEKYSR
jgi:hypothetical protein